MLYIKRFSKCNCRDNMMSLMLFLFYIIHNDFTIPIPTICAIKCNFTHMCLDKITLTTKTNIRQCSLYYSEEARKINMEHFTFTDYSILFYFYFCI